MKRLIVLLMLLCVIPIVCCYMPTDREATAAAVENPIRSGWGTSSPAGDARVASGSVVRVPAGAKELVPCKLKKGLSRKERREVGATPRNVRRILGELQAADPVGFEQSSSEELAIDVAAVLVAENSQVFQALERDWEEFLEFLLAFLEKLIPLIIQLITIFS